MSTKMTSEKLFEIEENYVLSRDGLQSEDIKALIAEVRYQQAEVRSLTIELGRALVEVGRLKLEVAEVLGKITE